MFAFLLWWQFSAFVSFKFDHAVVRRGQEGGSSQLTDRNEDTASATQELQP